MNKNHVYHSSWEFRTKPAVAEPRILHYSLIARNGFGCTMFRTEVLRDAVFTPRQPPPLDFNPAFYDRLKASGWKARLCWDAECQHLDASVG